MENNNIEISSDNKSYSLLVVVSCISVFLLIAYFGVTLTSKGTFSSDSEDVDQIDENRCVYTPNNDVREIRHIAYCDKYPTDTSGNEIDCSSESGKTANANTHCYTLGDNGRIVYVYNRCDLYDESNWRCQTEEVSRFYCEKDTGQLTYIAVCRVYGESQNDTNGKCGVTDYMLYDRSELEDGNNCLAEGASFVSAYGLEHYTVNGVNMCNTATGKKVNIKSCNYGSSNVVCYTSYVTMRSSTPAADIISRQGIPIENLADVNDPACNSTTTTTNIYGCIPGNTFVGDCIADGSGDAWVDQYKTDCTTYHAGRQQDPKCSGSIPNTTQPVTQPPVTQPPVTQPSSGTFGCVTYGHGYHWEDLSQTTLGSNGRSQSECTGCENGYTLNGNGNCVEITTTTKVNTTAAANTTTKVNTTSVVNTTAKANTTTTEKTDDVVNPQTGTAAIVIAWIVGIVAMGYAFYYFKQTSKN